MKAAKPLTYAYAFRPPYRPDGPVMRSLVDAAREDSAALEAEFETVARRFQRRIDHVVWELEGAASLPFARRPQGAKLLDSLKDHDLVIAAQLGEVICAAAEAQPLVEAFLQRRARLFVADIDLELTAQGETTRRALGLLAALAKSYDEQRRALWAAQQVPPASEGRQDSLDRNAQAAARLQETLTEPTQVPGSDERMLLDPQLDARLLFLLETARDSEVAPEVVARTIAVELGLRLTPQQVARLMEKRRTETP